ncbi:MAG: GAF domain-containing protein [Flavobacteriaceae bacterium]|nr:GAF domain-containing protein [Flavobacteriaceae bacterium]
MNLNNELDSPLIVKISFNKLIQRYEHLVESDDEFIAAKAKRVISTQKPIPELRDGFSDLNLLQKYKKEIGIILQDSFSEVLTDNEIKTASVPFEDIIFNSSDRFKKILETAGDNFQLNIKNMPQDNKYIIACTIILNFCYGYSLNFKRPFSYEIPDKNGVMRYYKILYNADFIEISPTQNAPEITQDDYDELIDNYENIDIWKKKFPPQSYVFKGFVISNIFDVTDDQSISNIKSFLINEGINKNIPLKEEVHAVFQSLFNIQDLKVGFSSYDLNKNSLMPIYDKSVESYLLHEKFEIDCAHALCSKSFNELIENHKVFTISDIDKIDALTKGKSPQVSALKKQGFKSAILVPLVADDTLLGVMEFVSKTPKLLNSISEHKLLDVMPFVKAAIVRSKKEEENKVDLIIQEKCTSIHSSVFWKFEDEAKRYLFEQSKGNHSEFHKISFKDVYPLFGQIDIKNSSNSRNKAIQKDLTLQLLLAKEILMVLFENEKLLLFEQFIFQINQYLELLSAVFRVDTEQRISVFLKTDIFDLFKHLDSKEKYKDDIAHYFDSINDNLGVIYKHRKNYDDTIMLINKEMAFLLDKKQQEAQAMYPHFYERFKTDGVEHNMYIGESITREDSFNKIYLYNLRLWQLQVMCDMENTHYNLRSSYPMALDVATMILVFNTPLTISFRMDEKQFDVDGTYNARYEVVKKRVDKSYIKGTKKRVTEQGKITIVYSHKQDELEYLRYITFLQTKHYLADDVQIVELEDLQAVTGLKAIKVSVLYKKENDKKEKFYTYKDLMKELEH